MNALVKVEYLDVAVSFTEDAWFNATAVAERFGKRIQDWLENQETKDYIAALAEFHDQAKDSDLHHAKKRYVKTSKARVDRGGGTWMHPDLAVPFARWLDVRFGVWCDQQIKQILSGKHQHYDWKRTRHEATASFKVMNQILQMTRQRLGKTSAPHHFSNEARLINYVLTGVFGRVDRDELAVGDLDLLAKLENLDTVLIGCGTSYEGRKAELEKFAAEQRANHRLEA